MSITDRRVQTPAAWQLGRISIGFFIDLMEIARDGRDLLSPLLLSAVVEANVAPINQNAAHQQLYAHLGAPPPDALRRPVSVNAIAESLCLPFETVRRRLRALEAAGLCQIGAAGVLVPAAILSTPAYERVAKARYERLKQLYVDLRGHVRFDDLLDPPRDGPEPDALADVLSFPPVRLCNRLIGEYAFRITEILLRKLRDPYAAFILLNIARANVRHLPLSPQAKDLAAQSGLRAPIRPSGIAQRLGLPPETVRRRLKSLEAQGFIRRSRGGVILSDSAVESELMQELMGSAMRNSIRLFSRLRAYGVLDRWNAVESLPAPRPPSAVGALA